MSAFPRLGGQGDGAGLRSSSSMKRPLSSQKRGECVSEMRRSLCRTKTNAA